MQYSYRRLKLWMRTYYRRHGLKPRKGFSVRSNKWGRPAQLMWQEVCKREKVPVTLKPTDANINLIRPFRMRLKRRIEIELGTKEWPAFSNWGEVKKYLAAAGIGFPAPWCAAFVTYCVMRAGWKQGLPAKPAWVPSWESWAKARGYEVAKLRARKGDIVTFNWDADPAGEHIGFIARNYGAYKSVATIEGNATSSALPGGGVVRKLRRWSQVNHVYRLPN